MADVRYESASRIYPGTEVPAVDALDLDIADGELLVLVGPSGSGKSTALRMLAGLETVNEGSIYIDDVDVTLKPPQDRDIAMVFQNYALYPSMTVAQNMGFALKQAKVPKAERDEKVREAARILDLEEYLDRKPKNLSGGQRQRVALARSLAKAPKLLLLDEPLGALDAKLRQDTQFELMDIQEKTGTTFVIVTHDQEEAMTVASRVAVMDHGRIIQADTPARMYEMPGSVYVADFIGEVTIIEGTATPNGDSYDVTFAEGQPTLKAKSDRTFAKGQACHLAIRPEKVAITADKPEGAPNAVQGKILDIAYLGNLSTYHVELSNGQIIKSQTANTRRLSQRPFTWEDEVWLSWSETAGVLLEG